MTKKIATKAALTDHLSEGAQLLGAIAHWSLRNFCAPRADFQSQLSAHGLDPAYSEPSGRYCLRRALSELRGKFGFRRIPGLKDIGGTALLWYYHDSASDKTKADHAWSVSVVEVSGRAELLFARKDGSITPDAIADELRSKVNDAFELVRDNALTTDLSLVLTSGMTGVRRDILWGGVSLRESGGVYFIAPDQVARVEAFRDYVQSVSPATRIDVMRLHDSGSNRSTVARSASEGFATELAELRTELDELVSSSDPSQKSINAKASRFRLLRARVDMFSGILGDVAGELAAKISDAEAQLKQALEAAFTAGAQPAPEPVPEPVPEPAPAPVKLRAVPEAKPERKTATKAERSAAEAKLQKAVEAPVKIAKPTKPSKAGEARAAREARAR